MLFPSPAGDAGPAFCPPFCVSMDSSPFFLGPGPALPPLVPFSRPRSSFSSLEVYPLNFDEILSDPDLGSGTFSILRRTWTQECGVPRMTGVEEIFAFGTVHPALPAQLELLPEEYRHEPVVLIHSTEPLSLGEEQGDSWTAPDEILCGDAVYRVFQVRPWQAYGFWKAWAVRI